MKKLSKVLSNNLLLIAILVFAFALRILLLGKFPIGMTHDELNNIFAAKSLFSTLKFPPGTAPAIIPTTMSNFTITIPEVPAVILAPIVGPFSTTMFMGRFAGALLSVLSILALYLLALRLLKSKSSALLSALLMAINPWSFLMGRTMCEVNVFVALFLWGFLVLIDNRGWKIFYAIPFYILGFFSYTGGQISFFVYILLTLIYHYFSFSKRRKDFKKYLIFTGIFIFIFLSYIFISTHNQSFKARSGELYLPTLQSVSDAVDKERLLSVPSKFNSLFINKATVYASGFVEKYVKTYSVDILFLRGEVRAVFSYQEHGTFYLIDLIFIIIGISTLFSINKKAWFLVLGILIGYPISTGLSLVEDSYSQRAGLIYPFLIILLAVGIGTAISFFKSKKIKIIVSGTIIAVYFIFFINLMHIYFFRFPVYASDGWFFQDRVLSTYIFKTQKLLPAQKIFVYIPEPKIVFEEYLFYNNLYNRGSASDINIRLDKEDYFLGNVRFSDECPKNIPEPGSVIIFDSSFNCSNFSNLIDLARITRLKDIHTNYVINNDLLCKTANVSQFVLQSAYKNFNVERQSVNDFCSNWITRVK